MLVVLVCEHRHGKKKEGYANNPEHHKSILPKLVGQVGNLPPIANRRYVGAGEQPAAGFHPSAFGEIERRRALQLRFAHVRRASFIFPDGN